MISRQIPLAVVGAGPAGMEAAATAAEYGLRTILIDSAERPGGQYFRQTPAAFSGQERSRHGQEAAALFRRTSHPFVTRMSDTVVWGIFPRDRGWELALNRPGGPSRVIARYVILAPGAQDRPVPFPGWTLPGVMTAGGVQSLLKSQRVLPGKRFLLTGTGPLQLAVAAGLLRAGGEVVLVLEGTHVGWGALRYATAAWGQWARLAEGLDYAQVLRSAHAQVRVGWSVVAATGRDQVECATIARLDRDWRPVPGTEQQVEVDSIVSGYGFAPSTELSRLAGCEHVYRREWGGLAPVRDGQLLTCQPGIYVAGDAGGIGGAGAARIEGRLAALGVCRQAGCAGADGAAISKTRGRLARERRFAAALAALFAPGDGLDDLATDDTLICRCEDVTLAQIRKTVRGGASTLGEIKGLTCAGMGNCQGRTCGTLLPRLVARELAALGLPFPTEPEMLKARPPVHPLLLQTLAQYLPPYAGEEPSLPESVS